MRRTDRLFEIIQILRNAAAPVKAADIAAALEISKRTIYRDIATLQAMRTPIEGAPGLGYMLRRGYDLPPINFDVEEAEAIAVGLSLITRTGDKSLLSAAKRAARKLHNAAPANDTLITSDWGTKPPVNADPADIRAAIRTEVKLALNYQTPDAAPTNRTVLPIAMIYYIETTVLVAWCELRQDFRHFRLDRITDCTTLPDTFTGQGKTLRAAWETSRAAENWGQQS